MSPDKAAVITQAAATLLAKYGDLKIQANAIYIESCVKTAVALYEEASRQVRASGPTSTEPQDCSCGATAFGYKDGPTHDAYCPRFFRA